jgi:hypothetical protein
VNFSVQNEHETRDARSDAREPINVAPAIMMADKSNRYHPTRKTTKPMPLAATDAVNILSHLIRTPFQYNKRISNPVPVVKN